MNDEDFVVPAPSSDGGFSEDQLKDLKSCAISLYLIYKAIGAPAAYQEMVTFSAKCLSEKWEMERGKVEAALGQTMLFLAQSEWCHIILNRGGQFTHAANADPIEIKDDASLLKFFKEGLAMIPANHSKIILP